MEIMIKRTYFRREYTVGYLFIDGVYFCDTLESHAIPWKDQPFIGEKLEKRVAGKTAIPEGTYLVKLRYSATYKRVMPILPCVPEFGDVVFRTGSRFSKTRGDILVGNLAAVEEGHPSDQPKLGNSLYVFKKLFRRLEKADKEDETIWLKVRSPKLWKYPVSIQKLMEKV